MHGPAGINDADRRLAMAAIEKKRQGGKPNRAEVAALQRIEKANDEESRARHFAAVRKGELVEWTGRQCKIINEQAERYGWPLLGKTVDLPVFFRALWDWLAVVGPVLSQSQKHSEDDDVETVRWRRARASREELKLQRELGNFLDIDLIRDGFSIFAARMRETGESLQKECGNVAYEIFKSGMEKASVDFEDRFGDSDPDDTGEADFGDDHDDTPE